MSVSYFDNNIRIWNANNLECVQNINNINNGGWLNPACFLKENNTI